MTKTAVSSKRCSAVDHARHDVGMAWTVIVFIVACVFGAIFLRQFITSVNTYRDAMATAPTATGQVGAGVGLGSGGLIEMQGAAKSASFCPTIVSPLSGKTCVWWSAVFEKRGDKNKWITKHTITSEPWLCVDDGTGPALVSLLEHRPEAKMDVHYDSTMPKWLTGAQLAMAAKGERINLETPPPGFEEPGIGTRLVREVRGAFDEDEPISSLGGSWRVVEHFIERDSPVYVIGSATTDESADESIGKTVLRPTQGKAFRVRCGTETELLEASAHTQRFSLVGTTVASFCVAVTFPLTWWAGLPGVNVAAALAFPLAVYFGLTKWVSSRQRNLTKPDRG
jgi:hypothetical protein